MFYEKEKLRQLNFILLGLGLLLLFVFGQNCSLQYGLHISNPAPPALPHGENSGNGQSYDGKLTFLQFSPNFTCENKIAPQSVLRRDDSGVWRLTENKIDKCASLDRLVVNDVNYPADSFYFIYHGNEYYLDHSAPENPSGLDSYPTQFRVSAKVDANSHDFSPGDQICADATGSCSLRAAIEEANASPNTASFISLTAGTYLLSSVIQTTGQAFMVIKGESPSNTFIDGGTNTELLEIGSGNSLLTSSVLLRDLSLNNGNTLNIFRGAAITIHESIRIFNTFIEKNIYRPNTFAVRVGNYAVRPKIIIEQSKISNNGGSALGVYGGSALSLLNVDISYNSGMGIEAKLNSGDFIIQRTTFAANTGIGVHLQDCNHNCLIENSTFYLNDVAGVFLTDSGASSLTDDITIRNSTFWANGAYANSNIGLNMNASAPRKLRLQNSIIGHNPGFPGSKNCDLLLMNNFIIEIVNSIATDTSCSSSGFIFANPELGALSSSGGVGATMTPLAGAGSPAIDNGDNLTCSQSDQIGHARPHGFLTANPICDIGAIEVY